MRKTLVIAVREYQAAVRTKTFAISLVIMPIMASAGLIAAVLFKDVANIQDKRIAVIDRTGMLFDRLAEAAGQYNRTEVFADPDDDVPGPPKQIKARFVLERVDVDWDSDGGATRNEGTKGRRARLSGDPKDGAVGFKEVDAERTDRHPTLDDVRIELSDRVRRGELAAFVEIGADTFDPPPEAGGSQYEESSNTNRVTYHSNNPMDRAFAEWLDGPVQSAVREFRFKQAGLSSETVAWATNPAPIEHDTLFTRSPDGCVVAGRKSDSYVHIAAGIGMSLLLSMVVLVGAMPLTYSVLEEKIQRSAEVLLGAATPFQFMMGKLLGMVGVSLSIVTIYLVVGFFTADYFGYGHTLPRHLVYWFVVYQAAAIFIFGSIYIAIGAACNDMKDAQNLMTPASLIACTPLFLIRPVMLEPDSTFSTVVSFFPPATPMLMLLRQSLPAPVPAWQPIVGLLLVVVTAVFCVGIAGRIFRVGILMQGKGANLKELFHWAFSREARLPPDRRGKPLDHSPRWAYPPPDESPAL